MAKTKDSGIGGGGGSQIGVNASVTGSAGPSGSQIGVNASVTTAAGGNDGFQKGWAASGPNGTLTQQDLKDIQQQVKDIVDLYDAGDISYGEFNDLNEKLADAYGISADQLMSIKYTGNANGLKMAGEENSTNSGSAKKSSQNQDDANSGNGSKAQGTSGKKSAVDAAKGMELAGQNGKKWPPSADNSPMHYQWHTSKDIFDELGGSYYSGGVGGQNSKEMYSAIKSFTGSGYTSIRNAQLDGDTTSAAGKKGQKLEEFIAEGVKRGHGWEGGTTYRGIGVSESVLNNFLSMNVGDVVDCNGGGSASWSTQRKRSESFAHNYGGPHQVVFVHTGKKQNGVSVKHLSSVGTFEQEVLCSKNNKYKVQAIVPATGTTYGTGQSSYTYIYVEDA